MRTACSRGQLANGGGSGGADRDRGVMRTPACRQEGSSGGAVGRQGGLACCGEKGSAWRGSAERAKGQGRGLGATRRLGCAGAVGALWARPVHAHHLFSDMPWPARWLGWSWGLAGLV